MNISILIHSDYLLIFFWKKKCLLCCLSCKIQKTNWLKIFKSFHKRCASSEWKTARRSLFIRNIAHTNKVNVYCITATPILSSVGFFFIRNQFLFLCIIYFCCFVGFILSLKILITNKSEWNKTLQLRWNRTRTRLNEF